MMASKKMEIDEFKLIFRQSLQKNSEQSGRPRYGQLSTPYGCAFCLQKAESQLQGLTQLHDTLQPFVQRELEGMFITPKVYP